MNAIDSAPPRGRPGGGGGGWDLKQLMVIESGLELETKFTWIDCFVLSLIGSKRREDA